MKLQGAACIVTGASRGIGRALSLALVNEGARVLGCARNEGKLAQVVARRREQIEGVQHDGHLAVRLRDRLGIARREAALDALEGATPERVERDWSQPYEKHPAVTAVFKSIYQDPKTHWDAYDMCEKLVDVEENFQLWRFRHVKTVERIIGFKPGTGGTAGVAFLRRSLEGSLFPELIDVRTEIR